MAFSRLVPRSTERRCRSAIRARRTALGCGQQAGHTPYMDYRGPGTRALLLAGRHRKKGLLTVKVPVVPRSGIRQGRPSTAPPQIEGRTLAALVRSVAHGAVAAGHRGPCPCRGQPVSCGAVPRAVAQRLSASRAAMRPDRRPTETAAAPARCRPVHGPRVMLRPRVETQPHRIRNKTASRRDANAILSRASTAHYPFNHSQAGSWSRRPASPTWRSWAAVRRPAIKRLVNAQQNAHRCDPSGGDPGGCSARPSCRGIRLRVSQP